MELTTVNITLVELAIFGASGMAVGAIVIGNFKRLQEYRYLKMLKEKDDIIKEKDKTIKDKISDIEHLNKMLNHYKPLVKESYGNKMYKTVLHQTIEDLEKRKYLAFGWEKTRAYVELEALKKVVERTKEELGANPFEEEASNE